MPLFDELPEDGSRCRVPYGSTRSRRRTPRSKEVARDDGTAPRASWLALELCQATKLGHSAEFQARGSGFYARLLLPVFGPEQAGLVDSKDWVIEEPQAEIAKLNKKKKSASD